MNKEDQIKVISEAIHEAKYSLKPLAFNLIFWGVLISVMSLFHYFFPEVVQFSYYSSAIYWISIPLVAMVYTTYYNIKTGIKIGYETQLGRVIKIIWGVFCLSWMLVVIISMVLKVNPVQDILFTLGLTLIMTGIIIKFKQVYLGGLLLLAFVLYTNLYPGLNFLLINVIGIFFGMLIPGIALYRLKETK